MFTITGILIISQSFESGTNDLSNFLLHLSYTEGETLKILFIFHLCLHVET